MSDSLGSSGALTLPGSVLQHGKEAGLLYHAVASYHPIIGCQLGALGWKSQEVTSWALPAVYPGEVIPVLKGEPQKSQVLLDRSAEPIKGMAGLPTVASGHCTFCSFAISLGLVYIKYEGLLGGSVG